MIEDVRLTKLGPVEHFLGNLICNAAPLRKHKKTQTQLRP